MSLIDRTKPAYTITDVADKVRDCIGKAVNVADHELHQIRSLVQQYTRSAIAAELGDDAADMLTVYTKLKEAIETAKQITVDELP